jgi:hypothetical protein
MPELIKSIAPSLPAVRCPGCFNMMNIKTIEALSQSTVDITYRCERCEVDTKRRIKASGK